MAARYFSFFVLMLVPMLCNSLLTRPRAIRYGKVSATAGRSRFTWSIAFQSSKKGAEKESDNALIKARNGVQDFFMGVSDYFMELNDLPTEPVTNDNEAIM